ncbi:MAG: ABC transporter ATP-binding protein [Bacteroidota bacterium]
MILRVEKLSKQYNHKDGPVDALKDITLNIKEGSFVTITGPSGSGKTTLLLALSGLIRPTSGHITFKEQALETATDNKLAHFRKNHVGFVMQNFSLIPYLTAIQNVMIPLSLQNVDYSRQLPLATAVLELVGLGDRLNHLPRELSSGQQQRVSIARALINKPSVIFADEPTGNLDPSLAVEILEFLKDINQTKGITIILATHSPLAAEYGNIRIQLKDGKTV